MPLWVFSHTKNAFSDDEKLDLAKAITDIYTSAQLPAFYVSVHFEEISETNMYLGGEPAKNFTMISINHVARSIEAPERKERFMNKVDAILNPRFKAKGLSWEYFIQNDPRDTWKIDGFVPPPTGSEMELKWLNANKIVLEEGQAA